MKKMNQYYLAAIITVVGFGLMVFVIIHYMEQNKADIQTISNKKDVKIDSLKYRITKLEYQRNFYKTSVEAKSDFVDGLIQTIYELRVKYEPDITTDKTVDLGESPGYALDFYDNEPMTYHDRMMDNTSDNLTQKYFIPNAYDNITIDKNKKQ